MVMVMDTSQGSETFLQYEESEEPECPTEGSWCCGADLFPLTELNLKAIQVHEMVQVGEGKAFLGNW